MEIAAIIIGPVAAVLISLWLQRRHRFFDNKLFIFFTLMAYRKSFPIEKDWAKALNLIDVVFAREKEITQLWHKYYDLLGEHPRRLDVEGHVYIELLSAIAVNLGYKKLQQTDIDKFYLPQGLVPSPPAAPDLETEFLRVLKNTERFLVEQRKIEPPGTEYQTPE